MMDQNLDWLLKWYCSQCDGDWEHGNGIEVGTLEDNSGWYVKICISETGMQNHPFEKIETHRSNSDWIDCFVKNEIFEGTGGSFNLSEILQIFREWVESYEKEELIT